MKKLSEILKVEREKKKLLLRQAAAILEIDQAILSKIERDERKPTKEQMHKFIEVYNLNKNKLMALWLGEKVYKFIYNEPHALDALKIAEKELKYGRKEEKK